MTENPLKENRMEWFNIFGMVFMAFIMVPNIIYAMRCKDGFQNNCSKTTEMVEQIGRYGCFATMIFNIPGTWFGFWSDEAFAMYMVVNALLVALYCLIWVICWKKNSMFRALALSILPSAVFLFSGIMSRSILLTVAALLFAPAHIYISCRNAV